MLENPLVLRRAFLSVSDTSGLLELVLALMEHDVELITTEGTYQNILKLVGKHDQLKLRKLEDLYSIAPILEGRVKSLHPLVYAGLLFDKTRPAHQQDQEKHHFLPIDLLVVNFYAFADKLKHQSFEQSLDAIDIGGVSLVRAAAKNFASVAVLTDPEDYPAFLQELTDQANISYLSRKRLMQKAWKKVFRYDQSIFEASQQQSLEYGENPHQQGFFVPNDDRLLDLPYHRLSYNNLLDCKIGLDLLREVALGFPDKKACFILKHNIPAGAALAESLAEALRLSLASDPVSAYGGVLFFNGTLDLSMLQSLSKHFFDLIFATGATAEALNYVEERWKKKLLVLIPPDLLQPPFPPIFERQESSLGNFRQTFSYGSFDSYESVTQRPFDEDKIPLARFGVLLAKYTKSNAVSLVHQTGQAFQLVGLGSGQPNRLDAITKLALAKMASNFQGLKQVILVSDGFLPFADNVEALQSWPIGGIVQPGGSVRDREVIEACDRQGLAMILTHQRYFKH